MEDVIVYFFSVFVIVVDICNNMGGEDRGGQVIVFYFIDQEWFYMINLIKNGFGFDDFIVLMEWYICFKGFIFN